METDEEDKKIVADEYGFEYTEPVFDLPSGYRCFRCGKFFYSYDARTVMSVQDRMRRHVEIKHEGVK